MPLFKTNERVTKQLRKPKSNENVSIRSQKRWIITSLPSHNEHDRFLRSTSITGRVKGDDSTSFHRYEPDFVIIYYPFCTWCSAPKQNEYACDGQAKMWWRLGMLFTTNWSVRSIVPISLWEGHCSAMLKFKHHLAPGNSLRFTIHFACLIAYAQYMMISPCTQTDRFEETAVFCTLMTESHGKKKKK